jgi:serine/threonine-protein kinase HipA
MKVLSVYFHGFEGDPVLAGRLAYLDNKGLFEYSPEFLTRGINLSPFALKLHGELQSASADPFHGLQGVFNDSLPDGWGLYIMDKTFRQHGIDTAHVTPLDRLAFMGSRAMGALSYLPDEGRQYLSGHDDALEINKLAEESVRLYTGEVEDVLDELAINGTPSGGARPKILLGLNGKEAISGAGDLPDGYEHWLAKFPTGTRAEQKSEGSIEFIYSMFARRAGIEFSDTQLIEGGSDNFYFVTKRFDRQPNNQRLHVHTLAGLINANFRVADCDYKTLIKVCSQLTKSHEETTQLFKRMLFNILSGNRDDHTKNFSFYMTSDGSWKNTPAYDITYNKGINGEHTMDISGFGRNIAMAHIEPLAKIASLDMKIVKRMVEEISESLSGWANEASNYAIPAQQVTEIESYINTQRRLLMTF